MSKPDNIVKRNPSQTAEKNVFNPSKYYYANIKSEPNDILEPVLQKVYQEKKEDYSVPVYPGKIMSTASTSDLRIELLLRKDFSLLSPRC